MVLKLHTLGIGEVVFTVNDFVDLQAGFPKSDCLRFERLNHSFKSLHKVKAVGHDRRLSLGNVIEGGDFRLKCT